MNKNKKYCYMKTFSLQREFLLRKFPKWKLLGPKTAMFPKLLGLVLFILMFGAASTYAKDVVLNFPDLKVPVAGINPVTVGGNTADELASYTVAWITNAGASVSGPFSAATIYKATLKVSSTSSTVNLPGSDPEVTIGDTKEGFSITSWSNSDGTLVLTFDKTNANVGVYTAGNLSATTPVAGSTIAELSTTAISNGFNFSKKTGNNKGWEKKTATGWTKITTDTKFTTNTVYRAYYGLTAKNGYTFFGSVGNDFKGSFDPPAGTKFTLEPDETFKNAILYIEFPATELPLSKDITDLFATPVAGQVIQKTFDSKEFTANGITWTAESNNVTADTFSAGTVYTAAFSITAKPGYSKSDLTENYFSWKGVTTIVNYANGDVSVTFPATAKTMNFADGLGESGFASNDDWKAILDAATPEAGATAKLVGFIGDLKHKNFDITAVEWKASEGKELDAKGRFQANSQYSAWLTITPKKDYTSVGSEYNKDFSVASYKAQLNPGTDGNVIAVISIYAKTAANPSNPNAFDNAKNLKPKAGVVPTTTFTVVGDYTVSNPSWIGDLTGGKFKAATLYTLSLDIVLTNDKLTLFGLAEKFYTVTGATGTKFTVDSEDPSKGTLVISYPETETLVIPKFSLVQPKLGAQQVNAKNTGAGYSITTTWDPNDAKFKADRPYTAKVKITANDNYTLFGLDRNSAIVTSSGVKGITYDVDTFFVAFNNTEKAVTFTEAAPLDLAPTAGQAAPGTVEGTGYTGTVVWTYINDYNKEEVLATGAPFKLDEVYTAKITLTAKQDYSLATLTTEDIVVKNNIDGKPSADAGNIQLSDDHKVITIKYNRTPADANVVSQPKAAEITATAVAGKNIEKAQWKESVGSQVDILDKAAGTDSVWRPSGSLFQVDTEYYFKVAIAAKPGFTLKGVNPTW
jgi:hypothetical protein